MEYLPGQFDQRADSCAQCIQLATQKRPSRRGPNPPGSTCWKGDVTDAELCPHQGLSDQPGGEPGRPRWRMPETLDARYAVPETVATLERLHRPLGPEPSSGPVHPYPVRPGHGSGRRHSAARPTSGMTEHRGPHHHRGADDRHLLVRPLPPHHLLPPRSTTFPSAATTLPRTPIGNYLDSLREYPVHAGKRHAPSP